jgi:hypothetical protein
VADWSPAVIERFRVRDAGHSVERDANYEALVLAEQTGATEGRRLEISRSFDMDEQGRRLGLDTHSVVNEEGVTVYGAVAEWRLSEDRLTIDLTEPAREVLGVDSYELTLEPGRVDVGLVQSALESIVGAPLGGPWKSS